MNRLLYGLWLSKVLGPASPRAEQALAATDFGSRPLPAEKLAELGVFTKAQLEAGRALSLQKLEQALLAAQGQGLSLLLPGDENYPLLLREAPSPPLALYVKGDPSLLQHPLPVGVVGARRHSAYGEAAAGKIAAELAQNGALVVSGLAEGLDGVAHKAALESGAPTLAFVAGGVDRYYPACNRALQETIEEKGAVVSEYPPGTQPQKSHFLQRNRLIAGFCRGVCVVEARARSGALSTAHRAAEAGREVFAVPGSIFSPLSEGANALLLEGAIPALSGAGILLWYGKQCETPPLPAEETPCFSPAACAVLGVLSAVPLPLEEICQKTGLPAGKAMAALSELEMEGAARHMAGQRYSKGL